MTKRKNEMASVTGIKERGWTDGLIRRHLGEPDELAPNPHYRQAGAPMRLYRLHRVERAERGCAKHDLAAAAERRDARRAAAQKAVATKTESLVAEIDALEITVQPKPWSEVVRAAMANDTDWRTGELRQMHHESDAEFRARMVLNHLRHECTNYHDGLRALSRRVGGRGAAYERLRDRIEDAIYDAYPQLEGQS